MTLRIFQKGFNYSQDGPGNRLVYHLQGCNMICPWCSNPEGKNINDWGKDYSIEELVDEVVRSKMLFIDGGGVTLTGGEATMQLDGVKELFKMVRNEGVNTCMESNGTNKDLPELFIWIDYLIMDLKHYDGEQHRKYTGQDIDCVIQNISEAIKRKQNLSIRIPLVGGVNASASDAKSFSKLLISIGAIGSVTVETLLYHEYGKKKYEQLGIPYTMTEKAKVTIPEKKEFDNILKNNGINVITT